MNKVKLSFLVPGIYERWIVQPPAAVRSLVKQTEGRDDVEVISLVDDRKMVLGTKRSRLLEMAAGEWIMFVDDDDRVHSDIVNKLVDVINEVDEETVVIPFLIHLTDRQPRGFREVGCTYSLNTLNCAYFGPNVWRGHPSHTMPWRTSFARRVQFPEKTWQEDVGWSLPLSKLAVEENKKQHQIDEVLYWYDLDRTKSATRR
jgi:hypothetical protein